MAMRFYQLLEMFKEICQFERHKNAKKLQYRKTSNDARFGLIQHSICWKIGGGTPGIH